MNSSLREAHYQTIWAWYVIIWLGFWLLTAHIAFRSDAPIAYSDGISGLLLILFGSLSISSKRIWTPWACAFVGVWLQFAPLALWAPNPASYINDTLIGTLVIALSILIPGIPGTVPDTGPSVPGGWSYNPSAWPQRVPIVVLGTIGWFISRYLAAHELGYIDTAWDPIFGEGTLEVITSKISRDFPVPDAGLGAMAYTLEVLLALKGDERRWRTMPWMVLLFGMLVIPLSLTSITLIILQPLIVHSWCSLCLFTALCMIVMIAFAIDEVIAVFQFLHQKRKEGKALWNVFWKGDASSIATEDVRTPPMDQPFAAIKSASWGINTPWNLLLSTLLGVVLMLTPWIFDSGRGMANSDHIVGAFTIIVSIISMAEVIRKLRYINVFLGAWILVSSFWASLAWPLHAAIGILIILFCFRRGKIEETYGSWKFF